MCGYGYGYGYVYGYVYVGMGMAMGMGMCTWAFYGVFVVFCGVLCSVL